MFGLQSSNLRGVVTVLGFGRRHHGGCAIGAEAQHESFVCVEGTHFILQGCRFNVAGINNHYLTFGSKAEFDRVLDDAVTVAERLHRRRMTSALLDCLSHCCYIIETETAVGAQEREDDQALRALAISPQLRGQGAIVKTCQGAISGSRSRLTQAQLVRTISEAPPSNRTDRSSPAIVRRMRRPAIPRMAVVVRHSGWI